MSPTKVGLNLKLGFFAAALPVAAGIISSPAVSSDRAHAVASHRAYRVPHVHRRYFAGHMRHMPLYGYYIHGQYMPGARDTLIYGPGYVFVPGHGILDEDCDMPTSTCSNEYRPVK